MLLVQGAVLRSVGQMQQATGLQHLQTMLFVDMGQQSDNAHFGLCSLRSDLLTAEREAYTILRESES